MNPLIRSMPQRGTANRRIRMLQARLSRFRSISQSLRRSENRFECLCRISRLVEAGGTSLSMVLERAIAMVPEGFSYPELVAVRLVAGDIRLSVGCRPAADPGETGPLLTAPIKDGIQPAGRITVRYARRLPERDMGPFLAAEKALLDAVAGRLGAFIRRFHAESDLKKEREQLLSIFENISEPIYVADPETYEILFANSAMSAVVGDSVGRKCHMAIQMREAPCDFCANPIIFGEKRGQSHVWEYRSPINGRWYRGIGRSIRWPDGRMVRCEIAFDINDIKMAEFHLHRFGRELERKVELGDESIQRLRIQIAEQRAYLSTVLDTMQAGLMIIDPVTHRIADLNRCAAEMIGAERDAIIGRVCHRFVCPSQEGKCPAQRPGQTILNEERVLLARGGRSVAVLKSVVPITVDRRSWLLETFVDISDLKALMRQQEMDITTARHLLTLTHGPRPRRMRMGEDLRLSVSAVWLPCNAAGGDHYFVREAPEGAADGHPRNHPGAGPRTWISLKDQSGHRVGAVLRAIVTDRLHYDILAAHPELPVEEQSRLLNERILENGYFKARHFATAVNAVLDHRSLILRYALCGHPGFHIIRDGAAVPVPAKGQATGRNMPLGALPHVGFSAGEVQLMPGDWVLIHTDGLSDAFHPASRKNHPEGPDGGGRAGPAFREVLAETARAGGESIYDIMAALIRRAEASSGERVDPAGVNDTEDDITLLGLEILKAEDDAETLWRPQNPRDLRDRLDNFLAAHERIWAEKGFEAPMRLRYALSEAVLNAWCHGSRRDPEKAIRLRCRYGGDFQIEVIDEGTGFDPKAVPDPTRGANVLSECGRGLAIIRRFADHAAWDGRGNRLVLAFDRQPGGRSASERGEAGTENPNDLSRGDDTE